MQSLKFTATSSDKEWIEGNKNRETYREHKEEICDRTESRNEDKEDFFLPYVGQRRTDLGCSVG